MVIETTLPGWLPDLDGTIIGGDLLRGWALSEVWRIRLDGATRKSVIAKRGIGELAGEARRYHELVVPLGIPAPHLLAEGDPGVIVLEDLGGDNLEDRPTAEGYEQAVRVLARMRAESALRLASDPALAAGLRRSTADLVAMAARADAAITALRPDLAGAIDDPIRAMTGRLQQLSSETETIVHGDFQAKNLLHTPGGGIVTIDWSDAYVHPHLGDLYLLLPPDSDDEATALSGVAHLLGHHAGTLVTVADQLKDQQGLLSYAEFATQIAAATPYSAALAAPFKSLIDGLSRDERLVLRVMLLTGSLAIPVRLLLALGRRDPGAALSRLRRRMIAKRSGTIWRFEPLPVAAFRQFSGAAIPGRRAANLVAFAIRKLMTDPDIGAEEESCLVGIISRVLQHDVGPSAKMGPRLIPDSRWVLEEITPSGPPDDGYARSRARRQPCVPVPLIDGACMKVGQPSATTKRRLSS